MLTVDGIFKTGTADLDRNVMQARLAAMQAAFQLGDAVHRVAVKTTDANRVAEYAPRIAAVLPTGVRLVDWNTLLPELEQSIELDRIIALMMYWLLMILVALAVVNAFIMTVFERTREFGMLLAIGMRPNAIVGVLTIEAVCVWALGAAIGIVLCVAVVVPLSHVGIDVASFDENFKGMAEEMMLPTHMFPALSAECRRAGTSDNVGGNAAGGMDTGTACAPNAPRRCLARGRMSDAALPLEAVAERRRREPRAALPSRGATCGATSVAHG